MLNLLTAAFFWIISTNPVFADDLKPFRIVAPQGFETEANEVMGFMKPIYKKLGYHAQLYFEPSARALASANNRQYDADLGRVAGVESAYPNLIRIPEPIAKIPLGIVRKRSDPHPPASLDEIIESGVAYPLGVPFLKDKLRDSNAYAVSTMEALVLMVAEGRVRYSIGPYPVLEKLVRQNPDVVLEDEPFYNELVFHYVTVDHSNLVSSLSNLIAEHNKHEGLWSLFKGK